MKILIVLSLIGFFFLPAMSAYGVTGDADLVLQDISIDPLYPEEDELVAITGELYNAGVINTDSLTSIITAAYFVDGKLLYIDEIGNVEPGIANAIKITSPPIWKSQFGTHEIKIILDYHDTLRDEHDVPFDNLMEKIMFIEPAKHTKILVDVSSQYFIQGKEIPKISITLLDSNTNEPLNDRELVLKLNDDSSTLITDADGKVSFSSTISSSKPVTIDINFDGGDRYSHSTSSLTLYPFSEQISPSLIIKLLDSKNQYNFENYLFDILIFQDSYDNLIESIQPDSTMLIDSETFQISLLPDHNYFAEIYLHGKFLHVTDKETLTQNSLIVKELTIPETGKIKFKVTDQNDQPIIDALVKNWIYSTVSHEDGFTDWIDVLPTKEPYVAEVVLHDDIIARSDPFLLFSGEQKIIEIKLKDSSFENKIPSWIKNNAGWWADGSIDDSSFIEGIQFLIQEKLMIVPVTTPNSDPSSDEIPSWIKNNAGWWADGSIDDSSFIEGIQFLIKVGILQISN